MPKGYILVEIEVPDPAAYRASGYMAMAEASVARHGGRFLIRGGAAALMDGDTLPGRVVLLEFPTRQAAQDFYRSEDYAPALALRHSLSHGRAILLDGYEPG